MVIKKECREKGLYLITTQERDYVTDTLEVVYLVIHPDAEEHLAQLYPFTPGTPHPGFPYLIMLELSDLSETPIAVLHQRLVVNEAVAKLAKDLTEIREAPVPWQIAVK